MNENALIQALEKADMDALCYGERLIKTCRRLRNITNPLSSLCDQFTLTLHTTNRPQEQEWPQDRAERIGNKGKEVSVYEKT